MTLNHFCSRNKRSLYHSLCRLRFHSHVLNIKEYIASLLYFMSYRDVD